MEIAFKEAKTREGVRKAALGLLIFVLLIVARQSLDVDVVAGATGSSLCILKATEIALYKGME